MNYHVSKPDESIKKIIKATFPSYKGKSIRLSTNVPSRLESYWDGGSKDSYAFYQLATGKTYDVHSNHPFFEASNPRELPKLPAGIIIVNHSYFCGKDMGITIYANESDLTPLIPEQTNDLSDHEKIVLVFTRSLKNSYGGESNIRFKEANRKHGITQEEWNEAQEACIAKKMLRKNGSITPEGRNAVADKYSY